jgi:molecular chaperone DnaJ
MPRDYYIVLGIERGADPSQIKRAYRSAIKRYHPDTADGDTSPRKFREAREAYEVLSDTDRRRAYDAQLNHRQIPVNAHRLNKMIRRRAAAREAFTARPSLLDAFFEGQVAGLYPRRPAVLPAHRDLYMEIMLSPQEARHGGIFPVTVPVAEPCPDCIEAGGWWESFMCRTCRGRGAVRAAREFRLTVPPDIRHGTRAEVPMDGLGLAGVHLVVDVLIER